MKPELEPAREEVGADTRTKNNARAKSTGDRVNEFDPVGWTFRSAVARSTLLT